MLPKGLLEQRLLESEVFPPKIIDIKLEYPKRRISHRTLGKFVGSAFYEPLCTAIFGGVSGESEMGEGVYPDIKDTKRGRFLEVKAASHSRRVMLKDSQIQHHTRVQISDNLIENPRLYVCFIRYGIRGMCQRFGRCKPDKLVEFLVLHTTYLVGLDFSIVHRSYSLGFQGHDLLLRNYGKGTPATHFSSTLFDLFFAEPEEALKVIGLSPEDHAINYRRLADGLKVNGLPVKPFPMVLIKSSEKEHLRFISELKKSN